MMSLRSAIVLTPVALLIALPSLAEDTPPVPVRIRGTIEKADPASLTVRTREREVAQVALTDKTSYSGVKPLPLSAIQPNTYVGVAGRPSANGEVQALEVLVFPETARGTGEGQREWDLLPGSNMTNATITAVVSSASGHDIDVAFHGKRAKISIPANTPIVTFTPAVRSDAARGLAVVVFATRDAAGKLSANRVVMEKDGVKPPM